MIDKSQIQRVLDRIQAAEAAMSDPAVLGNAKVYREKVREHAMLRKLESAAQAYFRLLDEREGNRELAGDSGGDPELAAMARDELDRIEAALPYIYGIGWSRSREILAKAQVDPDTRVKDLTEVEGVRTTWGSPIYKDHIPVWSDILVQNLEAEGGIIYAKSATPEFGAGANTFNEVFGATRNPWDLGRVPGGSSGGSAACLAAHEALFSLGSDTGGSIRQPASYCGVVGTSSMNAATSDPRKFSPSPTRSMRAPAQTQGFADAVSRRTTGFSFDSAVVPFAAPPR